MPSNLSEARSSTHKDATSEDATSIKTAHDTSTLITFLSHSAPVPDKGDKDSGVPVGSSARDPFESSFGISGLPPPLLDPPILQ